MEGSFDDGEPRGSGQFAVGPNRGHRGRRHRRVLVRRTTSAKPLHERLKLITGTLSRHWAQFGGDDTIFLQYAANNPLEAWEASK